jgi:hypothetical protein
MRLYYRVASIIILERLNDSKIKDSSSIKERMIVMD